MFDGHCSLFTTFRLHRLVNKTRVRPSTVQRISSSSIFYASVVCANLLKRWRPHAAQEGHWTCCASSTEPSFSAIVNTGTAMSIGSGFVFQNGLCLSRKRILSGAKLQSVASVHSNTTLKNSQNALRSTRAFNEFGSGTILVRLKHMHKICRVISTIGVEIRDIFRQCVGCLIRIESLTQIWNR